MIEFKPRVPSYTKFVGAFIEPKLEEQLEKACRKYGVRKSSFLRYALVSMLEKTGFINFEDGLGGKDESKSDYQMASDFRKF